jgi:DNA-binding GntR family transcriptional regulator
VADDEHLPLSRVSTVDALASALRERILDGDIEPDAHLSEVELAAAYGVGRHSLRAAFQVLARDGIVVHRRHRGAFVAVPTTAEMADLFTYRTALELGALQVALGRGARFDAAVGALAVLTAMGPAESWANVARVHHDLHAGIVAGAGSRRLADTYRSLQRELEYFVARIRPAYTVATMIDAHRRLVTAITGDDPAAAMAALEADLAGGRAALRQP